MGQICNRCEVMVYPGRQWPVMASIQSTQNLPQKSTSKKNCVRNECVDEDEQMELKTGQNYPNKDNTNTFKGYNEIVDLIDGLFI